MNLTNPASVERSSDLVINRIFNAPLVLVWQAWTAPSILQKWWGPKAYSCPYSEIDLHIGGRYLHCIRSPQGRDYWSTGVYRNIKQQEELSFTDSFCDFKGNVVPPTHYGLNTDFPLETQVTIKFTTMGAKSKLSIVISGMPEGTIRKDTMKNWKQALNKLAAIL